MELLKRSVPWRAKIPAKIVLSRLSIPYRMWKAFGLFEHGQMDRSSGFYTNRIRMREMLVRFRPAGLDVKVSRTTRWTDLPTPRRATAAEFKDLPGEDLLVSGFDCILRRER